jgi:hypothetical protein
MKTRTRQTSGAALTDLLFHATTSRMSRKAERRFGLTPLSERWRAAGGHLRVAGPKWFAVWQRDTDRLQRLRAIILPADWSGPAEDEMLAIFADQLRQLDPTMEETPFLSSALSRARSKLRIATMRGD